MTSVDAASIRREVLGDALELRISNPARANALTDAMLADLIGALSSAEASAARVVLLSGDGERHFSSGLDLAGVERDALGQRLRAGERLLGDAANAIEACSRPVVAVLNGSAVGGALELAAACDWRVAAPRARLAMPAARLGVAYTAEGLERFVRLMGPSRTRMVFLTGTPIDAERSFALGLIDHVVDTDEQLWPDARSVAAEIAKAAPLAVDGVRAVVSALARGAPQDARRSAATLRRSAFESADFREGLAAFSERRAPEFRGS